MTSLRTFLRSSTFSEFGFTVGFFRGLGDGGDLRVVCWLVHLGVVGKSVGSVRFLKIEQSVLA